MSLRGTGTGAFVRARWSERDFARPDSARGRWRGKRFILRYLFANCCAMYHEQNKFRFNRLFNHFLSTFCVVTRSNFHQNRHRFWYRLLIAWGRTVNCLITGLIGAAIIIKLRIGLTVSGGRKCF